MLENAEALPNITQHPIDPIRINIYQSRKLSVPNYYYY